MLSLEGISDDIARFSRGCECLLSALARGIKFSEIEKDMIAYYRQEIITKTQSLRDEREEA
jgi:hypothetical protein